MAQSHRILVTGGTGLVGSLLAKRFRNIYGNDNVIAADVRRDTQTQTPVGEPFVQLDITNFEQLEDTVKKHKIDWVLNQAAILSVACEENPQLAMKVNLIGFQNLLEVARLHKLRVFSASTIASFGYSTPKDKTPDVTIQRPPSLYGSTKVHNELIGEFYNRKYGVDFRCLRYPTVIAPTGEARGRVVDFAVQIFAEAIFSGYYRCDVAAATCVPYSLVDDTVDATIKFMEAPNEKLTLRTYNLQSFSASVADIAKEIQKIVPEYRVEYKPNKVKQHILNGFPRSLDISNASKDWGWKPGFGFEATVKEVIARLKKIKADEKK